MAVLVRPISAVIPLTCEFLVTELAAGSSCMTTMMDPSSRLVMTIFRFLKMSSAVNSVKPFLPVRTLWNLDCELSRLFVIDSQVNFFSRCRS